MKMTVKRKIFMGYFAMAILIFTLALTSIFKMVSMGDNANQLKDVEIPKYSILSDLRYDVTNIDRMGLRIITEQKPTEVETLKETMQTVIVDFQKKRSTFEQLDPTILQNAEYLSFKTMTDNYLTTLEPLIQSKSMDEAYTIVSNNRDEFKQSLELLTQALKKNEDSMNQNAKLSVQSFQSGFFWVSLVSLIAAVIVILLTFLIGNSITKPIQKLKKIVSQVSEGDLTISSESFAMKNKDEISELSLAFGTMVANLKQIVSSVGFKSTQLAASSEELVAISEESASANENIAITMQEVAFGAGEQGKERVMGIKQITEKTLYTSEQATASEAMAKEGIQTIVQVTHQMENIDTTVKELAETISRLGEHSHQIGKIVDVITDISTQTNLLALNAAIEASRAGEQGRGFMVVSTEVRKLAERSKTSSEQIKGYVEAIQLGIQKTTSSMEKGVSEVKEGKEIVQTAGDAFTAIENQVSNVTREIQMISEYIKDISTGAVTNVSAATEEQLAALQDVNASATELARIAEDLQQDVSKFKV